MYYCEFFSKYSDMFYYLTFLLGVTNISYNFFEYLSYSHKYDSSQLSKLEGIIHKLDGSIHTRLNDIDDKINMLHKIKLCEFKLLNLDANTVDSDSDSEKNESVIEDEVIHNNDEKCDFEIEEDTDSDTNDNEDTNFILDTDNGITETIDEEYRQEGRDYDISHLGEDFYDGHDGVHNDYDDDF